MVAGCASVPEDIPPDPIGHFVDVHSKPWSVELAPDATVAEVQDRPAGTRTQEVTNPAGAARSYIVQSKEGWDVVVVEELRSGKVFQVEGIPLPWRPISDLCWASNRYLCFDRWSQPHYGLHYVVDVETMKLVHIAPFPDPMPATQPAISEAEVAVVLAEIRKCPDWRHAHSASAEGRATQATIIQVLRRIRQHSLDVIREAVRRHEAETGTDDWKKLFMLNKYLFAWPKDAPKVKGPLVPGMDMSDEEYLSSWPFTEDGSGELVLTGDSPRYYAGPGYTATRHFDWCRKMLGLRRFPSASHN